MLREFFGAGVVVATLVALHRASSHSVVKLELLDLGPVVHNASSNEGSVAIAVQ